MIYETYRTNAAGEELLVTTQIEVLEIDRYGNVDLDEARVTKVENGDTTIPGVTVGELLVLTKQEHDAAIDWALRENEREAVRAELDDDDNPYDDMPFSERYNLQDDGPMHYV
jgi:hypothetical protein